MKKTRAAIVYGDTHAFATFATIEKDGRFLFVLDRLDPTTRMPRVFHPDQTKLRPATREGLDFEYIGDAIPIEPYDQLDEERRGFFYCT